MIENKESLSMAEVQEYLKSSKENPELEGFLKKFVNLEPKEAKELRKKLQDLDLMKIKSEHISKIIDILPETSEEVNKIFVDVSLSEDETRRVIDTVKEFK